MTAHLFSTDTRVGIFRYNDAVVILLTLGGHYNDDR